MGLLSGIGDAIGGVVDNVTDVVGGVGGIAGKISGIMNSPLGGVLQSLFPPAAMANGALSFASMLGNVADTVGEGADYMQNA